MKEGQIVTCIRNPINKDNTPNSPVKDKEYSVLRVGQDGGISIHGVLNENNRTVLWQSHLFELTKPKHPEFEDKCLGLIEFGEVTNYK